MKPKAILMAALIVCAGCGTRPDTEAINFLERSSDVESAHSDGEGSIVVRLKRNSSAVDMKRTEGERTYALAIGGFFTLYGKYIHTVHFEVNVDDSNRYQVTQVAVAKCNATSTGWRSSACSPVVEWSASLERDIAQVKEAQAQNELRTAEERRKTLQGVKHWEVGQRVCYRHRPGNVASISPEEIVIETVDFRYAMSPLHADYGLEPAPPRQGGQRLELAVSEAMLHSAPNQAENSYITRSDLRSNGDWIYVLSEQEVDGVTWYRVKIVSECVDPLTPDATGWLKSGDVVPIK